MSEDKIFQLEEIINKQKEIINNLTQYKQVLDENAIVSKTDLAGNITYVNEAFCQTSKYTKKELIGQCHSIVRHPDMDSGIFKDLWHTISNKKIWHGNIKNKAKDGSAYYVKSTIMPILDTNGEIMEFIAARTDVTEIVEKDEIIEQQKLDFLTKLYNRSFLLKELNTSENGYLLILLNINNFSQINDYFGYDIGDKILISFSKLLKSFIKEAKYFRISGDEFAILISANDEYDKYEENIEDLIKKIEKNEFLIDDYTIVLTLSVGLAYGKKNEVYKLAHLALKEAKERKINYIFYNKTPDIQKKAIENINTIKKIRKAINDDKIVPFYQGILNNHIGKITKYEVLMRLIDDDGTILTPYWFLEQAKKSRLYEKLTKIMLEKSFEYFSNKEFDFNINFTIDDILSNQIKEKLFKLLNKHKCGHRLTLEIVESEGIENYEEVTSFIKNVKAYGCKIAIDDFGTGYSNFEYITKLDIDYIKIDGSLIKDIDQNDIRAITVESIVKFAKKLYIKTVAEFVENENVQSKIKELGIDYSQGFLYSKPDNHI